jgi:hypothetical protein
MIVTHFGINNQTFNGGAAGSLELVGMEPERNQEYFSTMPGTNALVLPERQKIQFDYGWRIALLHGIIKSHNGLNIKFLTIDALF